MVDDLNQQNVIGTKYGVTNWRRAWLSVSVCVLLSGYCGSSYNVCAQPLDGAPSANPVMAEPQLQAPTKNAAPELLSVASPDGTMVARVEHQSESASRVSFIENSSGKTIFVQNFAGPVSSPEWLANNRSVILFARAHSGSPVHLYEIEGNESLTRDLTPFANCDAQRFLLSKNRRVLIVYLNLNKNLEYQPYLIDTASGAIKLIQDKPKFHRIWAQSKSMAVVENTLLKPILANAVSNQTNRTSPASINKIIRLNRFHELNPKLPERLSVQGQEIYRDRLKGSAEQRILFHVKQNKDDKYKDFTDSEKRQVLSAWLWVCDNLPGLVLRGSHNERVRFCRISDKKTFSIADGFSNSPAEVKGLYVELSDIFFEKYTSQQHRLILAHEMVHKADSFAHLSLSREWLDLVKSNISTARAALEYSRKNGVYNLNDEGAKFFGLPSIYAATKPEESLAEWVTAYCFDYVQPPDRIREFINEKVLNPDCREEQIDRKLHAAGLQMDRGNFKQSALEFSQVLASDPEFIMARYFLAQSYLKQKAYKQALKQSNELVREFENLNPGGTYKVGQQARAYYQHGDIVSDMGDYKTAQQDLNKAMEILPDEKDFRDAQVWLNGRLKRVSSLKKGSSRAHRR